MPNGSETPDYVLKGINEEYAVKGKNETAQGMAAERLETLAAYLREHPVSDRTAYVLYCWASLIHMIAITSPEDQARLAMALAGSMRGG